MKPSGIRDGIPLFASPDSFDFLQRHEFSHSFVNPLADKYSRLWEKHSDQFTPIKKEMEAQAYGQWNIVVYESIVRAVTIRLAYLLDGRDAGDKELQYHKDRGFVFSDALVKKLEKYEQNRGKYPTLDSFYPELLKALDGFSVRDALSGDDLIINHVRNEVETLVCEIPEVEGRDDAVSHVKQVHDRFFTKLEMIDATKLDEAALKGKLKGSFVLYTTIGSRLFKAVTEPLNIKIDGDTLHWNGVNTPVSELRLILVGKNPYGDGNCVVYAAGCNKLLVGINGCFHGQCSYHIFQDKQLLKEGYYNGKFIQKNP